MLWTLFVFCGNITLINSDHSFIEKDITMRKSNLTLEDRRKQALLEICSREKFAEDLKKDIKRKLFIFSFLTELIYRMRGNLLTDQNLADLKKLVIKDIREITWKDHIREVKNCYVAIIEHEKYFKGMKSGSTSLRLYFSEISLAILEREFSAPESLSSKFVKLFALKSMNNELYNYLQLDNRFKDIELMTKNPDLRAG